MPENNTQPSAPVSPAEPSTFSVSTPVQQPLSQSTVSGVMGATSIDNQNRRGSSLAVWIGFGMIIVAMIIAGAYYYMTMIQPETIGALPPEVNMPQESATTTDTSTADLDTLSSSIDASADVSDSEKDLNDISAEIDTVQ
jgi:hypothetical protein